MNRETKRRQARQGQIDAEGNPVAQRRQPPNPSAGTRRGGAAGQRDRRAGTGEFLREVRSELKKVAWPTRDETINYASVVLISLVVLTGLIFLLDLAFAHSVIFLFKT
jgi:preprotein translocase subunit SecE